MQVKRKFGFKRTGRIPKPIKRLSLIFFIFLFGINTSLFLLPLLVKKVVGTYALSGLLISFCGAIAIALDIPIGELIDRIGRKFFLWTGMLLHAVGGFIYFLFPTFQLLWLARAADGLGTSFVWDSGWTAVRDFSPARLESESMALFGLGPNLAGITAPLVGGLIAFSFGLRWAFILWSPFCLLAAILCIVRFGELKKREGLWEGLKNLLLVDKVFGTAAKDIRSFSIKRKNLAPFILIFFFSLTLGATWFVVPFIMRELQAGFLLMGLLFSLIGLPLLFQYHFSLLSDKLGEKRLISLLSIPSALIALWIFFLHSLWPFFGAILIFSLFVCAQRPNIDAILTKISPRSKFGELTGIYQSSKHLGFFVGPLLAGIVAQTFWLSATFLIGFVSLCIIGLTCLLS